MVCLDEAGEVVRPALLWNDTRSADAAADLVAELGARYWAEAVGSVPVASFTVSKLRWLAEHEPDSAARTAAVCLPHDWLSWRLAGAESIAGLVTDRSDASGTGYFDGRSNSYRTDLLVRALGHRPALPRIAGPAEPTAQLPDGLLLGPGAGDNAAAALGVQAGRQRAGLAGDVRGGLRPQRDRRRPTRAGWWPGSATRPDSSCRWPAP